MGKKEYKGGILDGGVCGKEGIGRILPTRSFESRFLCRVDYKSEKQSLNS